MQLMRRTPIGEAIKQAERIQEMRLPMPTGKYTVELTDVRNGKRERYESENYVSPAHYRRASHYQGILPFLHGIQLSGQYDRSNIAFNTAMVSNIWAWSPFHAPHCPDTSVLCSDWGEDEDTTVDWGKGTVRAWASILKTTVDAAGKRGLLNESECTLNTNLKLLKWVWDWTTQQGNGTFQSVMLGTVGNKNTDHVHIPIVSGHRGIAVNYTGLGINTVCVNSVMSEPATGDLWALVFLAANGGSPRIVKWTAAQLADATTKDGSGLWNMSLAGAIQCTPPNMTFTSSIASGASVYYETPSIVKIPSSTDMVMIGRQTNGTLQVVRFNASTGASVYNNTTTGAAAGTAGASTKITSCCYAGGKIWATAGEFQAVTQGSAFATNGYILRINPATGAVEATLPLIAGAHLWQSIVTDGTLLMVSTNLGILVMDQTGANVEPYNLGQTCIRGQDSYNQNTVLDQKGISGTDGYGLSDRLADTAVSPASGTWWQGLAKGSQSYGYPRSPGDFVATRSGGDNSAGDGTFNYRHTWYNTGPLVQIAVQSTASGHPIYVWHNDKLWVVGRAWIRSLSGGMTTNTFALSSCDGANMFSRAKLDSPVTKTNSQNMKISYELTLPDDWYGVPSHVNPLAGV